MGRPRSFDKERVLESALRVFWKKGYTATSLRDLASATGLTQGSLYNEFESKLGVFRSVLDFYIKVIVETRVAYYLGRGQPPLEGIRGFMVSAVNGVPKEVRGDACLLVKTQTELGSSIEGLDTYMQRGFRLIEDGFVRQLERAKDQALIRPALDARQAARQLLFLMMGLLVSSRSGADSLMLEEAVDFTLASYE